MISSRPELFVELIAGASEIVVNSGYYWDNSIRAAEKDHKATHIIQLTRQGRGAVRIDGATYDVPEGHAFCVWVPENSQYYYPPDAKEPWHLTWIRFRGGNEFVSKIRSLYGHVFPMSIGGEGAILMEEIAERFQQRTFRDRYHASESTVRLLYSICRSIESEHASDLILQAAHHMSDYASRAIRVKEIAEMAGLTREHFSRLFQHRFGISPGRYLHAIRMHKAESLLKETPLNLEDIASQTGFSCAQSLSRALRIWRTQKNTPDLSLDN